MFVVTISSITLTGVRAHPNYFTPAAGSFFIFPSGFLCVL